MKNLSEPEFVYDYEGEFTEQYLISLTETVEEKLHDLQGTKWLRTIIFCVIESVQNITHYSAQKVYIAALGKEVGAGKVSMQYTPPLFSLTASNQVTEIQKERLTTRLNKFNSLGTDELKLLWKELVRTSSGPDSKGGGIGFVEIIRKTGSPLRFSFTEAGNGIYNFILEINIDTGERDG